MSDNDTTRKFYLSDDRLTSIEAESELEARRKALEWFKANPPEDVSIIVCVDSHETDD